MNLRQLGEDRLLAKLLGALNIGKDVVAAAGDDCALVRFAGNRHLLVLKTDCVVESVHFAADADPMAIGWKAMMRPLSDFAAVSGVPQFALVTLMAPATTAAGWVTNLYRGLNAAAKKFALSIVGGETSNTAGPIAISISIAGFVEKSRWTSRRGGRPGDDLFVTGHLGGSLTGRHLRFVPRIKESRWLTKNFPVHAMMDISDGLGADLPRFARASKVGFTVDLDALPLEQGVTVENAVSDGEDYELLFAISPRQRGRLEKEWRGRFSTVALTRIGTLTKNIKQRTLLPGGYVHFQ
jgi:thiamine-monophosphate kinase